MKENYIKALFTAIFALISSILGVLTVPVLLMVACNVLDYATGLIASTYRSEDINSYKSIRGIMKKVCMWLLVIVGAIIDQLLLYASQTAGITLPFTFLVACIVAIWIICNEIISILENIKDISVWMKFFPEKLAEIAFCTAISRPIIIGKVKMSDSIVKCCEAHLLHILINTGISEIMP